MKKTKNEKKTGATIPGVSGDQDHRIIPELVESPLNDIAINDSDRHVTLCAPMGSPIMGELGGPSIDNSKLRRKMSRR